MSTHTYAKQNRMDNSASPVDELPQEPGIVVYTYATHSQGMMPILRESAQRYGYRLKVVGFGQKWRGYCAKLLEMQKCIQKEDDDTLVMCVDAFDVFLCRPARELREAFVASGHTFLIGAHRAPVTEALHKLRFGEFDAVSSANGSNRDKDAGPYKFLCAGTWMARAADARAILAHFDQLEADMDDQEMFIALRRRLGENKITLDRQFQFFATLSPSLPTWSVDTRDQIAVLRDRDTNLPLLYSGLTKSQPFVVHGPGHTDLSQLVAKFDFDGTCEPVKRSFIAKKVFYQTAQTVGNWALELFAVAFLLAIVALVTWHLNKKNLSSTVPQSITAFGATKVR